MRQCGILMPVSSLPGPCGFGTFGRQAYDFVDFLEKAGQQIWQLLPLNPTGYGDSPYQSCSAFAGNPYFIDLDMLAEDGLLEKADYAELDWGADPCRVDYGAMYNNRFAVLRKAYANFRDRCASGWEYRWPDDWNTFCTANENWLYEYAVFMAIKVNNGMKNWREWPELLKRHDEPALSEFYSQNNVEIDFWIFLQYVFDGQWKKLHAYAKRKGVKILGDMPIYASPDSVESWNGGKLFELDAKGDFARVAGCPPDYFSEDGQLWGNPLYDWNYHRSTGFAWWIARMKRMLYLYDIVRIDHFRGFDTYWAIPAGSPTARTGKWEKGPGMQLFTALKNTFGEDLPIVAEDLGDLCDSARQLLKDSGLPGMKVLQFAFAGGDDYLPYNYIRNCVVYPGTHDNTTLADWWEHAASAAEKQKVRRYLHMHPQDDPVSEIIRAAISSAADTAIIPMTDYLHIGAEGRLNTPGVLGGNWSWRAAEGYDSTRLALRIREQCALYGRCAEQPPKPETTAADGEKAAAAKAAE